MVWNENENDFYFLDGPHDGKKNNFKLLFIFWIIVWNDNENDFQN